MYVRPGEGSVDPAALTTDRPWDLSRQARFPAMRGQAIRRMARHGPYALTAVLVLLQPMITHAPFAALSALHIVNALVITALAYYLTSRNWAFGSGGMRGGARDRDRRNQSAFQILPKREPAAEASHHLELP